MADKIDISGRAPAPAVSEKEPPRLFGLTQAMALIVGSIIGVGIFNLPTSLATYGPITLVSMGLTTVGALALALLFASLSRRMPAGGGPYAYARAAFGNRLGFANAWSYWITAWAGNAAIAVGWVLYVEHFINKGHNKLISVLLVLAGLWIPAVINLSGVKNMGSVQLVTTIVKFVALAFMSIAGLFYISSGNYTPWNVSGESAIGAIGGGMAIALFSYLGVETAAVAAAKVRNPHRNIPRATVLGTIATAVVYLLSLTVVFGIVPTPKLATATAPFSDAINAMFGGTWPGNVMAIAVIISGFGALNGWTMICAEMPLAAAEDGLFPRQFKRISRKGVPAYGIIASTVLASIAMAVNYLGSGGATVFTTLVLMTGITAAIPYGFSALAQLSFLLAGVVAVLQGYSFAKFGARYPSAGGMLEYIAKGFGAGHFTGVTAWLVYLVFAGLIVVVMTAVNVAGSTLVARAQTVIVYVVLGILILFSVVTLANLNPSLLAPSAYPPLKDIVASVALTFFAFLGFGIITFTAKDLAQPSRQLPRAMYLALGIATVIYVAIALGVFGTLTVQKVIASGGTALAVAAEPALGSAGYWLIFILITVAHLRVRRETGASVVILVLAFTAAAVVLVPFVFSSLIHEPASIATLLAILVLSIGLDYGWKAGRSGRPGRIQGART